MARKKTITSNNGNGSNNGSNGHENVYSTAVEDAILSDASAAVVADTDVDTDGEDDEVVERGIKGLAKGLAKAQGKAQGKGKTKVKEIVLPPLKTVNFIVTCRGTTSLIVHNFGAKAKEELAARQGNKPRAPRGPKNPDECFKATLYLMPDERMPEDPCKSKPRCGFPAQAFKSAMVEATRFTGKQLTKAFIKGAVKIIPAPGTSLLPIRYKKLNRREDPVRIPSSGAADLRYRGEFIDWEVDVPFQINESVISVEQVIYLLDLAGFSIGIGEWRPDKDGVNGCFKVVLDGGSGQ